MTSQGSKGNLLSKINWQYPRSYEKILELTLICSDGRHMRYEFQRQASYDNKDNHRYSLKHVIRDHAPTIHYEYTLINSHTMERLKKELYSTIAF